MPDLSGLHLDRPEQQLAERTHDITLTFAFLLLTAGALWVTVPHMTGPFLFTWTLFVALYVTGRVGWDRIRRF